MCLLQTLRKINVGMVDINSILLFHVEASNELDQ
jgi:hypothetical protein